MPQFNEFSWVFKSFFLIFTFFLFLLLIKFFRFSCMNFFNLNFFYYYYKLF